MTVLFTIAMVGERLAYRRDLKDPHPQFLENRVIQVRDVDALVAAVCQHECRSIQG